MHASNRKPCIGPTRILAAATVVLATALMLHGLGPVSRQARAEGPGGGWGAATKLQPQMSLDALRARLEAAGAEELKLLYLRCSQETLERRLDAGEAMACSVVYDVLLRNYFGGDFVQLLAWSRAQQANP